MTLYRFVYVELQVVCVYYKDVWVGRVGVFLRIPRCASVYVCERLKV